MRIEHCEIALGLNNELRVQYKGKSDQVDKWVHVVSSKSPIYHLLMSLVDVEKSIFLNSENRVGVSDSTTEHVGLPHVRKSECEAKETDNCSGESEQITLGNRIDDESECDHWEAKNWLKASKAPKCTCSVCGTLVTLSKSS